MIKSFKHKGVQPLFETGTAAGIQAAHKPRLIRQLTALHRAKSQQDMDQPGRGLHPLKGEEAGVWSVTANGNWRLTFMFDGEDAILVDYRDYH